MGSTFSKFRRIILSILILYRIQFWLHILIILNLFLFQLRYFCIGVLRLYHHILWCSSIFTVSIILLIWLTWIEFLLCLLYHWNRWYQILLWLLNARSRTQNTMAVAIANKFFCLIRVHAGDTLLFAKSLLTLKSSISFGLKIIQFELLIETLFVIHRCLLISELCAAVVLVHSHLSKIKAWPHRWRRLSYIISTIYLW